ncbi:MAG: hypothetical protein Kow0069_07030 [Promethearchaeota archaeon]
MPLGETLAGIGLGVLATCSFSYAPVLQKGAVDQMDAISMTKNFGSSLRGMLTNRRWLLGAALATLGGLPYVAALDLVGISVLQPVMSFGFLVLVYFSVKQLGEKLRKVDALGIALMVAMPALLAVAGVTNVQASLLNDGRTQRLLATYAGAFAGLVGVLLLVDHWSREDRRSGLYWTLATGASFAVGALFLQGTFAVLRDLGLDLFDDAEVVARLVFAGDPAAWTAVVLAAASALANGFGVFILQVAFQKWTATRVGTINQTVNTLVAITGGIVVFGQEVGRPSAYAAAVAFALLGTALLGRHQRPPKMSAETSRVPI